MIKYLSITLGGDALVLEGDELDPRDLGILAHFWLRARASAADQPRIDALTAELQTQTAALKKAVKANTPHPADTGE